MAGTTTISEVAERTGFTTSALRFYESAGLVTPARTPAGYRNYSEADIAALGFIGRAKRLGLTLEEIAEIVPLLDGQRCRPVQEQLRSSVLDKIAETQRRATDLLAFLGQLQAVATRLGEHTPDGACDDRCGCTGDAAADAGSWVGATLIAASDSVSGVPIVCTLDPDDMGARIAAWREVVEQQVSREAIDGGVRLRLPRTTDITTLARLLADEQACCSFFTFTLTIGDDGVVLDTTAPGDGLPMIHAVIGAPA